MKTLTKRQLKDINGGDAHCDGYNAGAAVRNAISGAFNSVIDTVVDFFSDHAAGQYIDNHR